MSSTVEVDKSLKPIKPAPAAAKLKGFAGLIGAALSQMPYGQLTMVMPDGGRHVFGSGGKSPQGHYVEALIVVRNAGLFRRLVFFGHIGFAEAFMDGDWVSDDLASVFAWFLLNLPHCRLLEGTDKKNLLVNSLGFLNQCGHLLRGNNKVNSRKNISYHYDLSNDLFQIFLDETMTYSSAYFGTSLDDTEWKLSLKDAQEAKFEALCRKLNLHAGDHLLEIGCGWGGFAVYAVSKYGCRYTGITISKEQLKFAQERVDKLPSIKDKIEFRLVDYRNMARPAGGFSKIVSIEMIEAVGHEYYDVYFQKIDQLLGEDGLAALQMITCPDSRYDLIRENTDFIQKHIFPGSLLPCLARLHKATATTALSLHELTDMGNDYARTLMVWQERFESHLSEVFALGFDQVFVRKWRYYLSYCAAAFAMRNISVVQAVYTRPNNLTLSHRQFLSRFASTKDDRQACDFGALE